MQPRRFWVFSLIGVVVFIVGTGFQWVLVHGGVAATPSYVLKGFLSIELSFVLNRLLTWRDRQINMVGSFVKWNAQRWLMALPDTGIYALLVWLGMNWLVATTLLTGVFTIVNYVSGHLWSFRRIHLPKHRAKGRLTEVRVSLQRRS